MAIIWANILGQEAFYFKNAFLTIFKIHVFEKRFYWFQSLYYSGKVHFEDISNGESLLKGKDQYNWPPCTN
jgi:hypothetical protein